MTLEEAINYFLLRSEAEGHADATKTVYRDNLKPMARYFREKGIGEVENITPRDLREYLVWRYERLAPDSKHQVFRTLKTFFRHLHAEMCIPSNPIAQIRPPKIPQKPFSVFSPEQVKSLLAQCDPTSYLGARDRAIILTLYRTGLRAQEVCNLTIEDVDFNGSRIVVREGKGRKYRVVAMDMELKRELYRYIQQRNRHQVLLRASLLDAGYASFFMNRNGTPMRRRHLTHIIEKLGKGAGICGVRCSPHTFRHTFATNWIVRGGDIFSLQQILGHTTLEMVRRYVTLTAADLARKQEKVMWGR